MHVYAHLRTHPHLIGEICNIETAFTSTELAVHVQIHRTHLSHMSRAVFRVCLTFVSGFVSECAGFNVANTSFVCLDS